MLVVPDNDKLVAKLYDMGDQKVEKEIPLATNIFKEVVPSYQNGAFILATKNQEDKLQLKQIDSNGHTTNLETQNVALESFLKTNTYNYRDRLVTYAKDDEQQYYIQVYNGKVTILNLANDKRLSARPTNISFNKLNDTTFVPYWDANLKDDSKVQLSGILTTQNTYSISRETDERNMEKQFLENTRLNQNQMLVVNTNYPKQIYQVSTNQTSKETLLKTPKPLYQAKIHPLNQAESLLIGSTEKDEQNGKLIAYLYNEQNHRLLDVSSMFKHATYADITSLNPYFYKNENENNVYFDASGKMAAVLDVKTGKTNSITAKEISSFKTSADAKWTLFIAFLKDSPALSINWLIWVLISVFFLLFSFVIPLVSRPFKRKNRAESILLQATILSANETGTYINNQPRVRFLLRFFYKGEAREITVHQVISSLSQIFPGGQVMIRYNPRKNKAILVNENEPVPEERMISARLTAVRPYGAVGRGTVVELEFQADSKMYKVPAIEPTGFHFEIGKPAELLETGGITRLLAYNTEYKKEDMLELTGTVTSLKTISSAISNYTLVLMDISVQAEDSTLMIQNSQFIPTGLTVQIGMVIPVQITQEDFSRRKRLSQKKEGSATITSVSYFGYTRGERPVSRVELLINGQKFITNTTIEPALSLQNGDTVWAQYDEANGDAIIVRYSQF